MSLKLEPHTLGSLIAQRIAPKDMERSARQSIEETWVKISKPLCDYIEHQHVHEKFNGNIDSLHAETVFANYYLTRGLGILESGTDSKGRGRWWKYADGTLLQECIVPKASYAITTTAGSITSCLATAYLPMSFVNNDYTFIGMCESSVYDGIWIGQAGDVGKTANRFQFYFLRYGSATVTCGARFLCIGRWTLDNISKINVPYETLSKDLVETVFKEDGLSDLTLCSLNVNGVNTVGVGIIESGKNDNGYWRKFADGTMECWGRGGNTTQYSTVDSIKCTFPQSFINTDYYISMTPITGADYYLQAASASSTAINTTKSVDSFLYDFCASVGKTRDVIVEYRVIGMWTDTIGNLGVPVYSPTVLTDNVTRMAFFKWNTVTNTTNQYVHMKTNQPLNNIMFMVQFQGYSYGESKPIDATLVGYPYAPNNAIINVGTSGTHTCGSYKSSDGYAVLTILLPNTYYAGFILNQVGAGPQGMFPLTITASTMTASGTGADY